MQQHYKSWWVLESTRRAGGLVGLDGEKNVKTTRKRVLHPKRTEFPFAPL